MQNLAVAVFAFSLWRTLRRWGGVGLLLLGVVDSSPFPTLGSLDALNVVLSVRHKDLWLYYATMSLIGSLVGAYFTYRLGQRAGRAGLERRFGTKRLNQVRESFDRWGFGAVFVPAVVPPPFPTTLFFIGAGAFNFPIKKYVAAVALARSLRYGSFAYCAAHLGRHLVTYLRHPERHLGVSLGFTLGVAALAIAASIIWRRLQDVAAAERQAAAQSSGVDVSEMQHPAH